MHSLRLRLHPSFRKMDGSNSSELDLPGFRFHPTEEELLEFYLKGALHCEKLTFDVIGTINIYHHSPWELPGLAKIGEREWYFLVPRDMRHSHGRRPNRTTRNGFWKATGSDRKIRSVRDPKRVIGLRKTLVFYNGRAPRGSKTDWVMNEYRMPDALPLPKEDIVLCKVYRKATSLKTQKQRAAMELEDTRTFKVQVYPLDQAFPPEDMDMHSPVIKGEEFFIEKKPNKEGSQFPLHKQEQKRQRINIVKQIPPKLQLPNHSVEWMNDPFLLRSPWVGTLSPFADLLNF